MDRLAGKSADFLKALSHPTRIGIVQLLSSGELCVCEIQPALGVEQSTLSKHLAVLRKEGVVLCRKEGLKVIYSLSSKNISGIVELTKCVLEERWQKDSQLWQEVREA